jgi:hypothetical protein
METLDQVEILACMARREGVAATHIDFAELVRSCQRAKERGVRLLWPAAASALAAVLILSVCLTLNGRAMRGTIDPVAQLFAPAQVQLP